MSDSIEKSVFDWLVAGVAAAANDNTLHGVQIHQSQFGAIEKDRVIQIGPTRSRLAPNSEYEMKEYDGNLNLIILSRVTNRGDRDKYTEALDDVVSMGKEVARLMSLDSCLAGSGPDRVMDARWDSITRDIVKLEEKPFALANLPLRINQIGQLVPNRG